MNDAEIAAELAKPLLKSNVKPAQQFGPKGDYLEGWHVIAEANRIFGWNGWSYSIMDRALVAERERKIGRAPNQKDGWGVSYLCRVRVMVGQVSREDEGVGHGYDVDLGLAHESAAKEAVTDALKRTLRTFGNPFGLALYDKSRENVEDDTRATPLSRQAAATAPRVEPLKSLDTFLAEMDASASLTELHAVWTKWKDMQANPGAMKAKDRNKARLERAEPPLTTMLRTGTLGG